MGCKRGDSVGRIEPVQAFVSAGKDGKTFMMEVPPRSEHVDDLLPMSDPETRIFAGRFTKAHTDMLFNLSAAGNGCRLPGRPGRS